jgi:hypothetical protein
MDWIDLEDSCEHGNETSGSIKVWEILGRMNDWRLLKENSPLCSALPNIYQPHMSYATVRP